MALQRFENYLCILLAIAFLTISSFAAAPGYQGQVSFNGFAVPGATVTATQDTKKLVAVTDDQGVFTFSDITNGTWTIEVAMSCFAPMKDQVVVGPNMPPAPPWELKMLPLEEMKAETMATVPVATVASPQPKAEETKPPTTTGAAKPPAKIDPTKTPAKPGAPATPGQNAAPPAAAAPPEEPDQRATDGFLINGSVNNGAASPFAQLAAFGNNRAGGRSLYNGGLGLILDNSALDASPFALSGHATAKTAYNRITGTANFGGPIKIPHILKNGPFLFVGYQWTRNNNDTIASGLVPTLAERGGDLSAVPVQIFNPITGIPFTNNMIPVSTQAQSLLNLFPTPNITGNPQYNYQIPIISNQHQDALSTALTKTIGRKDTISGRFGFQSNRSSLPNLFGFVDTTDALGLTLSGTWSHRFSPRLGQTLTLGFSRQATLVTANFENVTNVSGAAGITGNNQDPINWGPPALSFSTLAPLSDAQSSHNRNQTASLGYSILWSHRNHSVTFGGDFRRQEFNKLSQQDARGTFVFTGTATAKIVGGVSTGGSDFADFLLGVPDTSSIAFGNADKYFRQSVYDAYVDDDWRVTPQLSVHVGVRWDYGAPITELFGRLVNLDIASNFGTIAPVIANNPHGSVTNQAYPSSLIRPDKHGIQPRLGVSWRPISGSSILVKAGYAVNFDTSVYQSIASLMAQQAPLSKSLLVQNSAACPLTLANGFNNCPSTTADTFAIDPNFRVGYVQTWQLSVQRDLPWSLQMTATYLGNKGTRGAQEFLPNTYPIGATSPCPSCPVGFAYLTSNGNSTRESGSLQLRRRLRAGLTSTLTYTYSKSIDDDSAIGGLGAAGAGGGCAVCAQDWLNLGGQRGLSNFDQRHLLNFSWQYTTGMGLGGKTLLSGWRGRAYKEWTFTNTITVGSGLPQTPIFEEPVPGTGFTGTIRPDTTGAPIYAAPAAGVFLNPAAYTAPVSGQWGTAGRNSITGPAQFSLNASLQRSFHLKDRYNLTAQFDANNLLNHVTYTSWNAIITPFGNPLFGTAAGANQMRTIRTTLRLRF
jgi:outer membrane receptor protein involved in Fe transport